jgi:hypothetical protein
VNIVSEHETVVEKIMRHLATISTRAQYAFNSLSVTRRKGKATVLSRVETRAELVATLIDEILFDVWGNIAKISVPSAGWFKPTGGQWLKLCEGRSDAICVAQMVEKTGKAPGEFLVLNSGDFPEPNQPGSFRRGPDDGARPGTNPA